MWSVVVRPLWVLRQRDSRDMAHVSGHPGYCQRQENTTCLWQWRLCSQTRLAKQGLRHKMAWGSHPTIAEVRKTLHRFNSWKAAGSDSILGWVLRECANQQADAFKTTTSIVPVSKGSSESSESYLNGYHPVTRTPIIRKHFERYCCHLQWTHCNLLSVSTVQPITLSSPPSTWPLPT